MKAWVIQIGFFKRNDNPEIPTDEQRAFIRELRPLNIEDRYPEDKDEVMQSLNHEICTRIYSNTEGLSGLSAWIKKKLRS